MVLRMQEQETRKMTLSLNESTKESSYISQSNAADGQALMAEASSRELSGPPRFVSCFLSERKLTLHRRMR